MSGGVPLTDASLSETDTVTVTAASVAPVRESVNAAAVPSVTGVADAAIDTTGSDDDAGPGTVAVAARASGSPSMQIASASPQDRAGRVMTISPAWVGTTVTSQPWFLPLVRRRAWVSVPPVTSSSPPPTVL